MTDNYYHTASELQKRARGFEVLRWRNSFRNSAALLNCDIDLRCEQLNLIAEF